MQTIYLDISNKGVIPCIQAKQSEVGRKFLAVITDNGVPYKIPDHSLLSVWYEGDTDAGNYSSIEEKSAFSISGNRVSVELVAQMLLKPGNGELCLSISHGDGGETNTWNIPYCVEHKPGAGSFVPTEYYTALTEAGATAAQYAGDAAISAAQANEAVVGYLKLDGTRPMIGDLNVGGHRITNLSNPVAERDPVTLRFLKDIVIPVGYIFHWEQVSGSDIDLSTPQKVAEHFGFGAWEQITDRFLLAAGQEHPSGSVGGSSEFAIGVDNIPSHTHELLSGVSSYPNMNTYRVSGIEESNSGDWWVYAATTNKAKTTGNTGGYSPISKMPPYRSVYVWKRIA